MLYTENSKGPDMHPLYHGVLQDMSQMTSSTIQIEKKQKTKTRVLYTNQRLTYSHSYSEMMNIKSLNCRDVIFDHKKVKYKHKTQNLKLGEDDKIKSVLLQSNVML